ncbi:MAG: LytC [Microbacteriaceae bacterium]|jgi:putative cell wall-binding protein|nr:LytC [Microbacteriaceae bacterium]
MRRYRRARGYDPPLSWKAVRHVVAAATAVLVFSFSAMTPVDPVAATNAEVAKAAPPELWEPNGVRDGADTTEAAALPRQMLDALERDLGITGEQYLAQADVAAQAPAVVDFLDGRGVDVLGSRLDGAKLVVHVSSADEAELVRSTGARAVVGEPVVRDFSGLEFKPLEDMRGGTGYRYAVGAEHYRCSVGFIGGSLTRHALQIATAGHCEGDPNSYRSLVQTTAGASGTSGSFIGSPEPGTFAFGGGRDIGVVDVAGTGWTAKPEVVTWGGGSGAPLASAPIPVRDQIAAIAGAPACKSGSTTGWTCGTILAVDQLINVDGESVNLVIADLCMLPGDSGGGAMIGSSAMGVNSAGTWSGTCDPAGQKDAVVGFFPMVSAAGKASVSEWLGGKWEISVKAEPPMVSSPEMVGVDGELRGTVPFSNVRQSVNAYFDGLPTARTASVSPDGSWSIDVSGLGTGSHSYRLQTTWGVRSASATVSGNLTIGPPVERLSGADRYEVAVAVSQRAFPSTAPVVYIATGANYPDALSAAPAAVKQGGPLLLTPVDGVPAIVRAEIERLNPTRVVVVGGPASVSPRAFAELERLAPTIRISGADRYEVSLAVVDYAFETVGSAYIVTGTNFPDALSAGAAGAAKSVPVILVNGPSASVNRATEKLLDKLGVASIKIAGGVNSVSTFIEDQLAMLRPVARLAGADRFAASQSINTDAFDRSDTVYLSTGFNYPDALAGAALAGKGQAPLFVVPTSCVPRGVLDQIRRLGASKVVLLGGPASLTPEVQSLEACSF